MSTLAAPETRQRSKIMVELYARAYWRCYVYAGLWVASTTALGIAIR